MYFNTIYKLINLLLYIFKYKIIVLVFYKLYLKFYIIPLEGY